MKRYIIFAIAACTNAVAWDQSARLDLQRSQTNNVNLTDIGTVSDSYNSLGAYIQTHNDQYKFKLKGRLEKYVQQAENDNYSIDLSAQYKLTKLNNFTTNIFKQTFNGTPLVSTDTTSDNQGFKLSANFNHSFTQDTNGYLFLAGTAKKYTKIDNRSDKILNIAVGLEHYFTENFMISPEFSIQSTSSSDSYYSNKSLSPAVFLSYNLTEQWELFLSTNFSRTLYSDRSVATISRRRINYEDEYQKLWSTDIGAEYMWTENFSLMGRISTVSNTSNNPLQEYKARILTLGLSIKI